VVLDYWHSMVITMLAGAQVPEIFSQLVQLPVVLAAEVRRHLLQVAFQPQAAQIRVAVAAVDAAEKPEQVVEPVAAVVLV